MSGAAILVADDDEHLLMLLRRTLPRHGFEVLGASDGREALELFGQRAQDLVAVLLDLKMPRLGGAEACRKIREVRPDLPIILSTGYAEEVTDGLRAELDGVVVLHKPYRTADLVEILREAVGS